MTSVFWLEVSSKHLVRQTDGQMVLEGFGSYQHMIGHMGVNGSTQEECID